VINGNGIGIFWGDPGTGKDFAVAHGREQLNITEESWIRLRFAHAPTEGEICSQLFTALSGDEPAATRHCGKRLDEIADIQQQKHQAIIIEEAQHWARVGFGVLRQIYDQSEEAFPLLLIGSEDFPAKLGRFGCLDRRAIGRQHFKSLSRPDVLEHLPGYHPLYRDAKPEVIAMVDQALCHGRLGYWAAFTHKALICAKNERTSRCASRRNSSAASVRRERLRDAGDVCRRRGVRAEAVAAQPARAERRSSPLLRSVQSCCRAGAGGHG
jgi:hypothetical protein